MRDNEPVVFRQRRNLSDRSGKIPELFGRGPRLSFPDESIAAESNEKNGLRW
jgi:hypothetical protein